jgi:Ca2+-binding EF-hand superfamily protein
MMRKSVLLASILAFSTILGIAGTASADEPTGKSKSKHDKAQAAFKKADKDGDGTLDKTEAKAMSKKVAKHFDEIDADKDGSLTLDEIHTYMKAHKKK